MPERAAPGRPATAGPATRARLTEPTELVFDRAGNLYFSDFNQGRVRRIDRRGIITTVARVPAAAGSRSIRAAATSQSRRSRAGSTASSSRPARCERLAGDGTQTSSGDGGAAASAQLNGPHDVIYDAEGNLLIAEMSGVRRIDAATGTIEMAFARPAFKVVAGPRGTFFLLSGSPSGGKVTQVDASGTVLRVIGTGKLSRHVDRAPIGRVGFLPSDVEPVGSGLLISQTEPIPAIRRLAPGASTLTTVISG